MHRRAACLGVARGSSMPGERGNIMTRGRSMPTLARARGSSKLGEQIARGDQHAL